jgi:foldase protein PrsA
MKSKMMMIIIAVAIVLVVVVAGVVAWQMGLFAKKAATVDGSPIFMSEVQSQLDRISTQHKTADQKKAFEQQKKQITAQILDLLIDEKVYLLQAQKMNITVTDQEVETEVNKTIKRFPSQAEFDKALKDAGMTMQDLRDYTKTRLITDKVNKKVVGTVTVNAAESKAYYDKNPTQFKDPEKIKVSHILVKTQAEAQDIINQLNSGADFATIAKDKSTDPASKANGGDLGYIQKGVMVPEFETAAFALQVGEYTQTPVKTQFGYHVIKVFDRTPEKQKTYDESKASIEQMLKSQKESAKIKAWLDGVKKTMTIKKFI